MSEFIPNGELIGRYRILAPIGQGGMATVYKVTDTVLERNVALKLIRIDQFPPAILDIVLKRFEREAKALARLNHPNIVKIHDYGEHENAPYLVMDFLPGQSFKQIRKPIPYKLAIHLIRPIADALAYAHRQGIFHRDVKPGNIMLTSEGTPILTDFGIAKLLDTNEEHTLTASGIGIGTPEYMAPEQGLGNEIDGRADQYSLAIVLYELITAHKPFQGNTPMAVILKQHNEPLPPMREFVSDVPDLVETVIRRALAKSPDQRFPDMTSFVGALEDVLRPDNSRLTVAPPSQTDDAPVFDMQPRPDSDTVPIMPFNTGPELKAKTKTQTPAKKKPHLATWLVPVALLVSIGAFFFLRRPANLPISIPSETAPFSTETSAPISTDKSIPQKQETLITVPFETAISKTPTITTTSLPTLTPTATFTPIASSTPTIPVEAATVSDFLEKKQYARLGAYIREISDSALQEQLKQFVNDKLFNGEIRLIPYRDCSGLFGYISTIGEVFIEPQFELAGDFSGGLAWFRKNGKWGYMNKQGETVIEPKVDDPGYPYYSNFSDGLAPITKNDKWGYMNKRGEIVIEPQFEWAGPFSEGFAQVWHDYNHRWGYINTLGESVFYPWLNEAYPFSEGFAWVKFGNYRFINTSGDFVIEPEHADFIEGGTRFSEGLAAIKIKNKWGYINKVGKFICEPQFDDAGEFAHGLAPIQKNYQWGYINSLGEVVVPNQFDEARPFSEGLALVRKGYQWGYINTLGEFIIEPQFDYFFENKVGVISSFSNGIAQVQKNGTTYFIDPTGETVFVACQK